MPSTSSLCSNAALATVWEAAESCQQASLDGSQEEQKSLMPSASSLCSNAALTTVWEAAASCQQASLDGSRVWKEPGALSALVVSHRVWKERGALSALVRPRYHNLGGALSPTAVRFQRAGCTLCPRSSSLDGEDWDF